MNYLVESNFYVATPIYLVLAIFEIEIVLFAKPISMKLKHV
jgi:hypothetical protein